MFLSEDVAVHHSLAIGMLFPLDLQLPDHHDALIPLYLSLFRLFRRPAVPSV